jgi:hypothetical protein
MKHDGVTATALMVLAAFAVERVTTGVLFMLSLSAKWRAFLAGLSKTVEVEKRQKLAYFVLAGALVLVVLLVAPEIRILNVLNIESPDLIDIGLTWLVMVAGSDRIGELVKGGSAAAPEKSSPPIEIKGSVRLVENDMKDVA